MRTKKIEFDKMITTSMVKDKDGFTYGIYNDRKPIYGYYLKAINKTLLNDIEIMAKSMFKLEKDSENYVQDARIETCLALEKFYNKFGYEQDEKFIKSWVYKVVKRKLKDNARKCKSNVYTFDNSNNEFFVNKILSFDELKEEDDGRFEDLECDIFDIYNKKDISNEFIKWLNNNKNDLLTKKQVNFLDNNEIVSDKGNRSRIKKKIYTKIVKNYGEYQTEYFKEKNKQFTYDKINKILDSIDKDCFEEFIYGCDKLEDLHYDKIINHIYEELQFNSLKQFSECLNTGRYINDKKIKYEIINILCDLL